VELGFFSIGFEPMLVDTSILDTSSEQGPDRHPVSVDRQCSGCKKTSRGTIKWLIPRTLAAIRRPARRPGQCFLPARSQGCGQRPLFTGGIVYFLRFRFDCGRLHTVEVTGSNPVSPTA
jgi:hypothetical protein